MCYRGGTKIKLSVNIYKGRKLCFQCELLCTILHSIKNELLEKKKVVRFI